MSKIEEKVAKEILARSKKGFAKYGVTMERDDLTRLEWLQHAKEEAMDLAVYLQKLIDIEQSNNSDAQINYIYTRSES